MVLQILWALALVLCLEGLAAATSPQSNVSKPIEVRQGEIAELSIRADGMTLIEARMGNEPIHLFQEQNGDFRGLIAADVEAKPGLVKILLHCTGADGASQDREIPVRIKANAFKKESFKVPAEYDQFTPDLLDRIRREQEQFARAYAAGAPNRLWESSFIPPLPVEITSPFGYRRVINGTPRAPHTGTDLKAAMGTGVIATNHGRVVLTGDFYFAGKGVVVDHGAGLFTMYFHLSEIKAEEGAEVRRGDVIGLSGMTGRVTGPHLHWAARLNGARVDPLELIAKVGGDRRSSARAGADELEK